MNWKEIKDKYPKSYAKWFNFTATDAAEKALQTQNHFYYSGILYAFFDYYGIYLSIEYGSNGFWYTIYEQLIGYYNSRTEAEEVAFAEAFEILENNLNSKQ